MRPVGTIPSVLGKVSQYHMCNIAYTYPIFLESHSMRNRPPCCPFPIITPHGSASAESKKPPSDHTLVHTTVDRRYWTNRLFYTLEPKLS
ncbi:uncharacterized protein CLUP02_15065 [Colletotrichum lupini]|uniref:Uncharacterized protein n=1 Tax=Colletotrichum lupini TaxID=145971 RepID=A0A9Q8T585_9PEZI|nr:uncharacterized protein CLUP02_15065 [Colletotrichum lupini]UQC89534.1 hypothetical protein CLUP02_15065 [Colletotrichum lupini]